MAKDNGTIHATLLQFSWYSHIQVYGPESWGNINQLRNKSVDIFGIKDQETIDSFALSQETFTGGVTPAATSNDKHYKLNVTYKDKAETFTGGFPVYEGNKPVLTLKELDFRIRQTLIKSKKLYNNSYNKGQIKITGADNNYTIDLSKGCHQLMQIDMLKNLKMQKLKLSSKNQTNNNNGVNKNNRKYYIDFAHI